MIPKLQQQWRQNMIFRFIKQNVGAHFAFWVKACHSNSFRGDACMHINFFLTLFLTLFYFLPCFLHCDCLFGKYFSLFNITFHFTASVSRIYFVFVCKFCYENFRFENKYLFKFGIMCVCVCAGLQTKFSFY